jgi:ABC-type antimicrobial peptide transport system permease subunit
MLSHHASKDIRNMLKNGLENIVDPETSSLLDSKELIEVLQTSSDFMEFFSGIITTLALALTFFLLFVSFVSNITQHLWEVGVLRALGLTRVMLSRIYIYEAVSSMVAAGALGVGIGICVSLTMALQFVAIAELPFQYAFSWRVLLFVSVLSIALSILAPLWATRQVTRKEIANIIKGV